MDFAHVQQLDFGQITQLTMRRQFLTELGGNDNKWLQSIPLLNTIMIKVS